jgi:hypothetical protein
MSASLYVITSYMNLRVLIVILKPEININTRNIQNLVPTIFEAWNSRNNTWKFSSYALKHEIDVIIVLKTKLLNDD